jgi:hypothetical protein
MWLMVMLEKVVSALRAMRHFVHMNWKIQYAKNSNFCYVHPTMTTKVFIISKMHAFFELKKDKSIAKYILRDLASTRKKKMRRRSSVVVITTLKQQLENCNK